MSRGPSPIPATTPLKPKTRRNHRPGQAASTSRAKPHPIRTTNTQSVKEPVLAGPRCRKKPPPAE
ncbi:hypothetical protein ZHAS_00003673 [Anopheles sinensis]|uniref:Uncharacterized protein n=1 Tax=Anopheles sinensis TaxID=74873 RepID=A0A084VEX5_ANOSI|nr:hypothetical protein ZHAS_00003673 [Anopheles sinensis]